MYEIDNSDLDNPLVHELAEKIETNFGVKIPFIIKDQPLFDTGLWNDYYYGPETMKKIFENTNWDGGKDSANYLFLDHKDQDASEWIGYVRNPRIEGNQVIGDLEIVDPVTAVKLHFGKPKFGVSARVKANFNPKNHSINTGFFENFSLVVNPAVKTAYINNSEVRKLADEEFKKKKPEEEEPEKASEEELKKKKPEEYPYPKMEELASKVAELEAKIEEFKKKKPEEPEEEKEKYPYYPKKESEEEYKKKKPEEEPEEMKEITDEFVNPWVVKIKKWLKAHPGKTVKDAIKALKKEESSEYEERITSLETKLNEPERLTGGSGTAKADEVKDVDTGMLMFLKHEFGGVDTDV